MAQAHFSLIRFVANQDAESLSHKLIDIRHLIKLDPDRNKRSVNIDIGLGTAVVSSYCEVKTQVFNCTVHNLQASIVNGISNFFHHSDIQELKAKTDHLYTNVDILENRIEVVRNFSSQNRKFLRAVDRKIGKNHFMAQVNFFKGALLELGLEADNIKDFLISLSKGEISKRIFNVDDAESALASLKAKVEKKGLSLVVDNVIDLYSVPVSYSIENQTLVNLFLHIETYSKEPLTFYEFIDIPLNLNNETFDIETDEKFLAITTGLQTDRESFVLKSNENLKCSEFLPKRFLCKDIIVHKTFENTCLPNLFYGNVEACSIRVTNDSRPVFVRANNERSLFLSLPVPTEVAIICPDSPKDSSVKTLSGIQQILPEPNCEVHFDSVYVPSISKKPETINLISRPLTKVNVTQLLNFKLQNVEFILSDVIEPFAKLPRPSNLSHHDIWQYVVITLAFLMMIALSAFIYITHFRVNGKCCFARFHETVQEP